MIGSVVPVVAKGRHATHAGAMVLIGLAGLLAVGGWSQPVLRRTSATSSSSSPSGSCCIVPVLASLAVSAVSPCVQGERAGRHPAGAPARCARQRAAPPRSRCRAPAHLRVIDPLDLIGTTADTARAQPHGVRRPHRRRRRSVVLGPEDRWPSALAGPRPVSVIARPHRRGRAARRGRRSSPASTRPPTT